MVKIVEIKVPSAKTIKRTLKRKQKVMNKIMKSLATRALAVMITMMMVGCTTVIDYGNGRVAVVMTAEQRSPFGTNMGFMQLQNCERHEKDGIWLEPFSDGYEYKDCQPMTPWMPASSQGQGGQVVQGLFTFGGLGWLATAQPAASSISQVNNGGNASASASSSSSATSAIINGGGHK